MKVLMVDIGGSNIKFMAPERPSKKFPSGPKITPEGMLGELEQKTRGWKFDAVSIGYPGEVRNGLPFADPPNLGPGWVNFDFGAHFQKPVRILNDASLQALGGYRGRRMLFLGLGTGVGSTLIADHLVIPLELGDLPMKKTKTIADCLSDEGLQKLGRKKWQALLETAVDFLRCAFIADDILIGGGNAKKLHHIRGVRRGRNEDAFIGAKRLWSCAPVRPGPSQTIWMFEGSIGPGE